MKTLNNASLVGTLHLKAFINAHWFALAEFEFFCILVANMINLA